MTEQKNLLTHYDQCHIQVRRDYFLLCAYNKADYNKKQTKTGKVVKDEPSQECMAKILRVFETLTESRRTQWHDDAAKLKEQGLTPPNEPKEFPLALSYGAIVELLYSTHGESTVRNSLAVLTQRGYIKQYQTSKNKVPLYILNIPVVQRALKKQAEDSLSGVEIDTPHETCKSQVSKSKARVSISTGNNAKTGVSGVEIEAPPVEIDTNKNRDNTGLDNNNNPDKNERNDDPPLSSRPDASSFIHSSDLNSFSLDDSSNPGGDYTLTQPLSPDPVGDTQPFPTIKPEKLEQHTSMQQSSEVVASSPSDAHFSATVKEQLLHDPIAMQTGVEMQNGYNDTSPGAQGYMTGNSEAQDSDAVMENETAEVTSPMAEVGGITQEQLLNWLKRLEQEETDRKIKRFSIGRIAGDEEAMGRLLSAVHGPDDVRDLYKIVRSQPRFSDGRIIYGLNLANEATIRALQEMRGPDRDQPMTQVQADTFAQWLMQHGFSHDLVAIDRDEATDQWYVCLQYESGEWLYLEGVKHYNNPNDWEYERIEQTYIRSHQVA